MSVSDQTTLNLAVIATDTLSRAGRARITSIQGKGIASSILKFHDCATAGEAASGNLAVSYTHLTLPTTPYV